MNTTTLSTEKPTAICTCDSIREEEAVRAALEPVFLVECCTAAWRNNDGYPQWNITATSTIERPITPERADAMRWFARGVLTGLTISDKGAV
jgi:hypothetical protein